MPFTKIGPDRYQSPSGRVYNAAQVRLYYANGGAFPGERKERAVGIGPYLDRRAKRKAKRKGKKGKTKR
jgi:hypothetical protein